MNVVKERVFVREVMGGRARHWLLACVFSLLCSGLRAAPQVSNVRASQRAGTKLVDITYDLTDNVNTGVWVSVSVKTNGVVIPAVSFTGAIGEWVAPGVGKSVVWDAGKDWGGQFSEAVSVAITAEGAPYSQYLVVDLSGGSDAINYPVSFLSAIPAGGWTDEFRTSKLVLRYIPAGSFMMGSPSSELGRFSGEVQHTVTLTKNFYMGVYEITQRQWALVMGDRPSFFTNEIYYATRPVERVSYYDIRENPINCDDPDVSWPNNAAVNAKSFMGRLRLKTGLPTFDLPTEAQWEYACRAGTTTALNSGKNLTTTTGLCPNMSEVGRYQQNGNEGSGFSAGCTTIAGTAKVGTYLPNSWGLYDMHGNVWEWCLDWDGTYPLGSVTNPTGPASGTARIIRGGNWFCMAQICRSANRPSKSPAQRSSTLDSAGFRVVRTMP